MKEFEESLKARPPEFRALWKRPKVRYTYAGMGRNGVTVTAFLKVPPPSQGNCICNCPISEHMYRTGNAVPADEEKFPFPNAYSYSGARLYGLRI